MLVYIFMHMLQTERDIFIYLHECEHWCIFIFRHVYRHRFFLKQSHYNKHLISEKNSPEIIIGPEYHKWKVMLLWVHSISIMKYLTSKPIQDVCDGTEKHTQFKLDLLIRLPTLIYSCPLKPQKGHWLKSYHVYDSAFSWTHVRN